MKNKITFLLLTSLFSFKSYAEFYVGGSINIQQNSYKKAQYNNKLLSFSTTQFSKDFLLTEGWLPQGGINNPNQIIFDNQQFSLVDQNGGFIDYSEKHYVLDFPRVILEEMVKNNVAIPSDIEKKYAEIVTFGTKPENEEFYQKIFDIHINSLNTVINKNNLTEVVSMDNLGQSTLTALNALNFIETGKCLNEADRECYNFSQIDENNKAKWEMLINEFVNNTNALYAELIVKPEPEKPEPEKPEPEKPEPEKPEPEKPEPEKPEPEKPEPEKPEPEKPEPEKPEPEKPEPEIDRNQLINDELLSIKKQASKTEFSASLFTGYVYRYNRFNFVTELGVDFFDSSVGKSKQNELEARYNANFYLVEKFGYRIDRSNLAYVTLGASLRIYEVVYNGQYSNFKTKERIPHFVFGVGYEQLLNRNIGMFVELNQVISLRKLKTEAGSLSFNSTQARVGARYYFR